ncbi:helix-turn-helix domain-containing protein [Methylobacterium nodulans]|uniref:helix-turn-helix domain-containing protein n=1 Tax=Methylobacterium nodulans TaxID=114616 RepID=UPI000A03942F|nr:LysR family transcriptional regulator [Methylobacterium nodulans]
MKQVFVDDLADVDLNQIRAFRIVAAAGSSTRAGLRLNLSQSAVSRQVASLEQSLKACLFHRNVISMSRAAQQESLPPEAPCRHVSVAYWMQLPS